MTYHGVLESGSREEFCHLELETETYLLNDACVGNMQLQLHGEAKRTDVLEEFHSKLNLFVSAKHNIIFLRWYHIIFFFICYRLKIFNS